MKKMILLFVVTLAASVSLSAQNVVAKYELPALHAIKTVTLSPAYSCRPADELQKGYAGAALFLSAYSRERNEPDLLFNGACRADDYFEAALAGDAMSLIADLGENVALEDLSAARAFNLKRIHAFAEYSKFADSVKVAVNHTYAVLLNEHKKRGLFVFTVVSHVPNEKVELRYAVKSYQITPGNQIISADSFDWEKKNQ